MIKASIKNQSFTRSTDITLFKPETGATKDSRDVKRYIRNHNLPDELKPLSNRFNQNDRLLLNDRYLIVGLLGSGGMGEVYKARDLLKEESSGRSRFYVAVKVLSEEFESHPQALHLLKREFEISQRITHPDIVDIYDAECHEGIPFMTMECVEGITLDEIVLPQESHVLPVGNVCRLLKHLTLALSYAHKKNIVHSDVKPGNVFVTPKGEAKLFDFGLSRDTKSVKTLGLDTGQNNVFLSADLMAFTPAYASPEMILGDEPDVRDDIYALGCIAYELFSGAHPYNKIPADRALHQGRQAKVIPHIKKGQWLAIKRAIALRRADRTATTGCFYNDIIADMPDGQLESQVN